MDNTRHLDTVKGWAMLAAKVERDLDEALLAARPVDTGGRPIAGAASLQALADALSDGSGRPVTRSAARARHAAAVKRCRQQEEGTEE